MEPWLLLGWLCDLGQAAWPFWALVSPSVSRVITLWCEAEGEWVPQAARSLHAWSEPAVCIIVHFLDRMPRLGKCEALSRALARAGGERVCRAEGRRL